VTGTSPVTIRPSLLDYVQRPLHSPLRWLLAAAAAAAAAAHVPVIGPHLDEAPYMGVLFVVLTVGCGAIGLTALIRDSAALYALARVTCGLAVIGYAATRLVAFPMLADDVGNWLEPLGVVSVVAELVVIATATTASLQRRSSAGSSDGTAREDW
jgi:hypothetical protein